MGKTDESVMTTKKKGLGRGLDALLGAGGVGPKKAADSAVAVSQYQPQTLGIDQLQRGRFQPRRHFDAEKLQELADSISAQGMLQPIVVRSLGNKGYEIIAGERRWRAAQLAGMSDVPVTIHEVDDQSAMAIALIENIQRDDLNPLEEAQALQRLLAEFQLTHQQIGQALGKSRTAVTNLLRLLELEPSVRSLLDEGKLEMGHARALLGLKEQMQSQAAQDVIKGALSVRATEQLVRRLQITAATPAKTPPKADPNIAALERDLSEKLGARVAIRSGAKGKGELAIGYNSLDELEGILEHIR